MIKKIYILLLTVLGMGVISSCSDYLNSEKYFKDRLTLEKTFESKDHVEEWLAYAFSFIKNENYEVTLKDQVRIRFVFQTICIMVTAIRQSMQQRMNCHIICSS